MDFPLFDQPTKSEIKRLQIQIDKAEDELQSIHNRIILDVKSAVSAITESKNRIVTTQKSIEQAQESFHIEEMKYQTGAGTILDYFFAETALLQAQANYYQALYDYNVALVNYKKSVGILGETL